MLDQLKITDPSFEASYKDSTGRKLPMFALDKRLTLVLVSGYNTILRSRIIDRWQELETRHALNISARHYSRVEHRPMTDAIKDAHSEPKAYHFSNEADMINRIVLGSSAAKFRASHEIEKDDSLRDYLTTQQIVAVQDLQNLNTAMIRIEMSFDDRKAKLNEIYRRKHSAALIEEFHRLEA
jgi:phage regulator Rha-like protein